VVDHKSPLFRNAGEDLSRQRAAALATVIASDTAQLATIDHTHHRARHCPTEKILD